MSLPLKIGIDVMGSDSPPASFLKALEKLKLSSSQEIVIFGPKSLQTSFPFVEAPEVIEMGDNPLSAVRKKKKASLLVAMRALKEGAIDALISLGNTGAILSSAKAILGTYSKFSRPALITLIPTKKKSVAVLDLGASVEAKAEHLIQFAHLGAAYQIARGVKKPSIGILNIGSEAVKGTADRRAAYLLLEKQKDKPFAFYGNIEGKTVFDGLVDVLVTDGFTGNVFLKTAEGLASFILDRLQEKLSPDILKNLQVELDDLKQHLHYAKYPGALLAGVKGTLIKCHSYSSPEGLISAVKENFKLLEAGFQEKFASQIKSF